MATDSIIQNARGLGRRLGVQAMVMAVALVASVLVWLILFQYLEHQESDAISGASSANANLAKEIKQHLLQVAKDLEFQINVLALELGRKGLRNMDLAEYRKQIAGALPMIAAIKVFDPAGNELSSSRPDDGIHPGGRAPPAHYDVDDSNVLRLGAPVSLYTDGKKLIPVTRRITSPGGELTGVLVLAVDPDYLSNTFGAVVTPGGAISLLNDDGIVLARSAATGDTVALGQNLGASPAFVRMKREKSGVLVFDRSTNGKRWVAAFESFGRYPLMVRVGSPVEEATLAVRQHWPGYYAVAAFMSLFLLSAGALAAWSYGRQEKDNQAIAAGKLQAEVLLAENRKRLQDFQESEERFRGLLTASSDGVWMHSGRRLRYVNDTLLKMLGHEDAQEVIGRDVLDFLPSPYKERFAARTARATGANAATPLREAQLLRRDGSRIDIEAAGSHFRQAENDWYITVIRDITQRKRTETELRTLSRAIEQSPESIIITDREGTINYVNPRFELLTGYSKEEVIGNNPRLLKSGATPQSAYEEMWRTVAAGGEWRGELCNRKKNGELYWEWASISGLRDENGGISHYVAVKENITERKGLQGQLRRATDILRSVTSNVPGMMFELIRRGGDYRFSYVSEGARVLFGFDPDTPQHAFETLRAIIRDEDAESFFHSLESSAQLLALWAWVGQVIGPQGELLWVQVRATPKLIGDGSLLWDGIAMDVTGAKTSELALNDTRRLLRDIATHHETIREEERMRIARELHDELGQVLTGVKLHLSAMGLRHMDPDDPLSARTLYVTRQVEQAIAMTRNAVIDLRPPALDQGLSAAIAWLADQFAQRTGIACDVDLPESEIELDETRATALFRILQESLTNVARHAGASRVEIALKLGGGRLQLQVNDDGRGFDQERVVAGRSFGLLGMRERVAMLGGRFDIGSIDGVGTTVAIEIGLEERTA